MARLCGERRRSRPRDATRCARAGRRGAAPRAGDFEQAVMELGATVCGARGPRVTPARSRRVAGRARRAAARARKRPRAPRPIVRIVCACITDGARVLVTRRAWAARRHVVAARGDAAAAAPRDCAQAGRGDRRAGRGLAYRGRVRHVFTHRDVTAELSGSRWTPRRAGGRRRWVSPGRVARSACRASRATPSRCGWRENGRNATSRGVGRGARKQDKPHFPP